MNPFGLELSAVMVVLAVVIGIVGLFAAMALFARNYIKVPPSTVAIFTFATASTVTATPSFVYAR